MSEDCKKLAGKMLELTRRSIVLGIEALRIFHLKLGLFFKLTLVPFFNDVMQALVVFIKAGTVILLLACICALPFSLYSKDILTTLSLLATIISLSYMSTKC